jgi:hypothetical protein
MREKSREKSFTETPFIKERRGVLGFYERMTAGDDRGSFLHKFCMAEMC